MDQRQRMEYTTGARRAAGPGFEPLCGYLLEGVAERRVERREGGPTADRERSLAAWVSSDVKSILHSTF